MDTQQSTTTMDQSNTGAYQPNTAAPATGGSGGGSGGGR
jgi:hypothetical protein